MMKVNSEGKGSVIDQASYGTVSCDNKKVCSVIFWFHPTQWEKHRNIAFREGWTVSIESGWLCPRHTKREEELKEDSKAFKDRGRVTKEYNDDEDIPF